MPSKIRTWRSDEPARQSDYRRTYVEVRKLYDRIASQDSCITYLLVELRAAQKRIAKLEQHNTDTATWKLKSAYEAMDEVRELEQQNESGENPRRSAIVRNPIGESQGAER